MRPKRYTLWLLALAVIGFGFYAGVRFLPKKQVRFDPATFDRIQPGMTRERVEAILGGPPGDYDPGCYYYIEEKPGVWVWYSHPYVPTDTPQKGTWIWDGGRIEVEFDSEDKVTVKRLARASCLDREYPPPTRR